MSKKSENINLMNDLMKGVTKVFLCVMIGVFPFYYQNNYINIVNAKSSFFEITVTALIAVGLVFIIPGFFKEFQMRTAVIKFSITDYFAILFAFTVVLSCILSPVGKEAFIGEYGRQLGGKALLLYVAVYFIVSRYYKSGQLLIWVFLIANVLMCILFCLNFWGINILNMYSNLAEWQKPFFMGTLGNVDINAEYFSVITALFMALFYLVEEKLSKICFGGAVVLGVYTCFATSTDSWLLAVGVAYVVIFALAMKDVKKLQKWWMLCVFFFSGSILIKLTERIDSMLGTSNVWITTLRIQEHLPLLFSWRVLIVELLLLGISGWMLMKNKGIQFLGNYGNKILLGIVLLGAVITAVKLFPLNDSFGGGRGYIWKRTIANFTHMPILQKLFGYGPNCFLQSMEERYGTEMRALYGDPFIDAHNEALQFLAVTGLFGVISYMGMQISLLVTCIRKHKTKMLAVLGCVGITAYILQGMVNNPQVFTTPILFIFLGVMDNLVNRNQEVSN